MRDEPETGTEGNTTDEVLRQDIELRAYFKYCERGCTAGGDVEDWLAAEQEILAERAAVGQAGAADTPETPSDARGRERTSRRQNPVRVAPSSAEGNH